MTEICDREEIQRCTAEIMEKLPQLASKHTSLVLVAALSEHVGGSLYLAQDAEICTPEAARAVIERVRQIAFTA